MNLKPSSHTVQIIPQGSESVVDVPLIDHINYSIAKMCSQLPSGTMRHRAIEKLVAYAAFEMAGDQNSLPTEALIVRMECTCGCLRQFNVSMFKQHMHPQEVMHAILQAKLSYEIDEFMMYHPEVGQQWAEMLDIPRTFAS